MKKLTLSLGFLTTILILLSFSVGSAQTAKALVTQKNEEMNPEADHSDDPYYCFEHNSSEGYMTLTLTEEEDSLMGVIQMSAAGDDLEDALFFFLSGNWTDDGGATFDMYMFDEDDEIIEESKQTATLKIVSDFEIMLIDGDGKEMAMDQILCGDDDE